MYLFRYILIWRDNWDGKEDNKRQRIYDYTQENTFTKQKTSNKTSKSYDLDRTKNKKRG